MTFDFFNEMEDIFGCKKNAIHSYVLSSDLPSIISKNQNIGKEIYSSREIHSSKKQKIDLNQNEISTNKSHYENKENKANESTKIFHKTQATKLQTKYEFEKVCL